MRGVAPSVALSAAVHAVPSVLVLAQWWPASLPDPGQVPGGLCRWRGPANGRPEVALTFDDGPDPRSTPPLLAALRRLGLPATFFCLGERVEESPGLVGDILADGHEVATHGHRHAHHLLRTRTWITRDLRRATATLGDVTGEPPRYVRPPYGQVSGGTLAAARRLGLELVLWSAWGREWADQDPSSVAARVGRRLRPGAIVLLHDSDRSAPAGTAATAARALEQIAETMSARQLKAVTLSELVAR